MNDIVTVTGKSRFGDICSLSFDWDITVQPGQFVMVWSPDMEEIPLSLSSVKDTKSITFRIIGKDTEALGNKEIGDRLSIRGPYGRGYKVDDKKRTLVVGGGIGIAPVLPMMADGLDTALAARTAGELDFALPATEKAKGRTWISTDDGSMGRHGNAVQLVKEILAERDYDEILACGPEVMLFFLHRFCVENGMKCQMSLERYMKCGCGICGSCMIDDKRVCADGPVFTCEEISRIKDFGRAKREPCGTRVLFR